MKKHIKIFALICSLVLVFIIYNIFEDNNQKIYYIALGDSIAEGMDPYGNVGYSYSDYIYDELKSKDKIKFYTKGFSKSGYTTRDLKNDIENNKTIEVDSKKISIKQALRESDLITISIGANDFMRGLDISDMYSYFNDISESKREIDKIGKNVKDLIILIKKYAKNQIILVGYYNPLPRLLTIKSEIDELVKYSYFMYEDICDEEKITCVNIYDLFSENEEFLPNPLDIHPSTEGYEEIANLIMEKIE